MKIFVGQIYIEAGVNYPFSHIFQRWISSELSNLVLPSPEFDRKYPTFNLVFNMSAKAKLVTPEIKGPAVFRKTKDVEYSIFLPHLKHDPSDPQTLQEPLAMFLDAVVTVLLRFGMDVSELQNRSAELVEHIIASPEMIKVW